MHTIINKNLLLEAVSIRSDSAQRKTNPESEMSQFIARLDGITWSLRILTLTSIC